MIESGLPYIVMTGGLVDLPELRFTPGGHAVVNFRLAGKKRIKDAQGQYVDGDPIYLAVEAWRELAENAVETLTRKGQRVTVTGNLVQQWWDKDDGSKGSKYVITAESISVDLRFSSYTEREKAGKAAAGAPAADDPWAAPAATDEPPF